MIASTPAGQAAVTAAIREGEALQWLQHNSVHRGQWCGAGALRSNMPAMAFGTRQAAERYSEHPNDRKLSAGRRLTPEIFTARLAATKVYCRTRLDRPDGMFDLDVIGDQFGREVAAALVRDYADAICATSSFENLEDETGRDLEEMLAAWPDRQSILPPIPAHLALCVPEFIQALKDAGYDAVACGGAGETAGEMEWHIFDAGLARDPQTGDPLPAYEDLPGVPADIETAACEEGLSP